ncbi:hypothetical protein BGZ75_001591 [Mortierella antarctica]|nr:hypothetical protein BGZ75_001591 [Mortierella antarctica]
MHGASRRRGDCKEESTAVVLDEEDSRSSQFSDLFDEPPSSPLADDYWDTAASMLRELAGEHEIGSAAGLREIRRRTHGGTEPMLRLRVAIKEAVRAAIVAKNTCSRDQV